MKRFIIYITILGLFGTVTNYYFFSPLPSLVAAFVLPIIILYYKRVPNFIFWLFLFTIYSLASTLLYDPQALVRFGFFRYDGNFFISYLPLLVLPFLRYNFDINKLFFRFLYITTATNLIVFLVRLINWPGVFVGLFVSTNAAGGFFSIVSSLALIYFLRRKNWTNLILLLLNVFFLYATYSRGSILGLTLGFFFLYLVKWNKKYLITIIIVGISLLQVYIIYQTFSSYKKYIMNSATADMIANRDKFIHEKYGNVDTKFNNVLIRAYETWPRAIDCFFHSPFFGTGFGSLTDVPYIWETKVPFLISTNVQEKKSYNDSHAHHSFLHFLGELGIIGLFIFLKFWRSLYRFLLKNDQQPIIRDFLLVSFFNLTIMSFTEHRITTPSNALPFVLTLSLYFVYTNYFRIHKKEAIINLHDLE